MSKWQVNESFVRAKWKHEFGEDKNKCVGKLNCLETIFQTSAIRLFHVEERSVCQRRIST